MIYGIDIGGSKIELAVFGSTFSQLTSWRVATPTEDYRAFIDALCHLVAKADDHFDVKAPVIGVAMAGLVDSNGLSLAANVPCANGRNVKSDLTGRLNREIALNNDCRLFALSEALGGAAKGYDNVFGAILGTGAGGGLVINQKLYLSKQGIAGEYGHFQLPAMLQQKYQLPQRPCGCGLANCVEGFIAGPGLVFLSHHFGLPVATVPEFIKVLRQGDENAAKILACYLDILAASFANIIFSYDPDVIVVGGGLSLIDEIVTGLPEAIAPHLFAQFNAPKIVTAEFGDASGVRGAALFASQMS